MTTESAWLIEIVRSDGTCYAQPQYVGEGYNGLTTYHLKAIRFSRKEDAERMIKVFNPYKPSCDKLAITEHQWDSGSRATNN